jgi:signal peptidase
MRLLGKLLLGTLLGLLLIAFAAGAWFTHEGYRVYAVRTGSMTPTYVPGDAVIDGPVRGPLHVGDVVTFRPSRLATNVTTHRIHRVSRTTVQTKGDANRTPDPVRVARSNVVGRVIRGIPKGGYVLYFFTQRAGIGALMAALFALCMLWSLFFPPPRVAAHSRRTRSVPRLRSRTSVHSSRGRHSSRSSRARRSVHSPRRPTSAHSPRGRRTGLFPC